MLPLSNHKAKKIAASCAWLLGPAVVQNICLSFFCVALYFLYNDPIYYPPNRNTTLGVSHVDILNILISDNL